MDISPKILVTILSLVSASLIACATFMRKLISYLMLRRTDRKQQEHKEDLKNAKNDLKDAVDNGDLSDLMKATKKLKEVKNG